MPNVASIDTLGDLQQAMAQMAVLQDEALRIYRPMWSQVPFHLSTAKERVVRGGNRSGKTVAASYEVGSFATGIPLMGPDGQQLPWKYGESNEAKTIWLIGYDEDHIGRLFRKLFTRNLPWCIRDEETGRLRRWNLRDPADVARINERQLSPPVIPPRLIDQSFGSNGFAFDKKAKDVFAVCKLKDGTRIEAYPSGGHAGQGEAVHLIWIDEDIQIQSHVSEWIARLADFGGKLIWSAWPHSANDALVNMSRRAEKQRESLNPSTFEIVLEFDQNEHIGDQEKAETLAIWASEGSAVLRTRNKGEFLTDTVLVYPTFNPDIHCLPSAHLNLADILEIYLASRDYKVPVDWTNYLILDPGHSHLAVLFVAVPPPLEYGDYIVIWDEIYTAGLNAHEVAEAVLEKAMGRAFEAFIIDYRAGRQTQITIGETMAAEYGKAFAAKKLVSETTGSNFTFGSDDVTARNLIVRGWLGSVDGRPPKLRLIRDTTPATQREFALYKKRVVKDDVKEEVVSRDNHAMDCLGYLAGYGPKYVKPRDRGEEQDPVFKLLRQLEGDRKKNDKTMWMGAGTPPDNPAFAA